MHNDIDKKFDHITQKALPYLVLAPPTFRNKLVELMDALFHQLLQRSEADFDDVYGQINEMLDDRKKFESTTEIKIHNFAGRFETYGQRISEIDKRVIKSERRINSLEKSVKALSSTIKKVSSGSGIPAEGRLFDDAPAEDTILKASGKFFCGICKNELRYRNKRYCKKIDKIAYQFRCQNCNLGFNMDADCNVLPIERTKTTLVRLEQLKKDKTKSGHRQG